MEELAGVEAAASPVVLAARTRAMAFRWLEIGAGIGACTVAITAWFGGPQPDFAGPLLVVAVLPFVLVACRLPLPRVTVLVCALPSVLYALDGGATAVATLPAMALVLTVPRMSRSGGMSAAGVVMFAYAIVGIARGEIATVAAAAGMGAAWAGGRSLGELFDRVHDLRTASEAAASEAVRAERRRLARELHDLVAHTLTGTMLFLAEIRLVIDSDPETARRALDEAERLARASLADLRGTVRLLSEADDPALEPPIDLDADLPQLLDRMRRAGVDITMRESGTPRPLSIASSWCTFRVVQESLTNAARHAPGAVVEVHLEWGRDGVMVKVRNGRANEENESRLAPNIDERRSSGRGIAGMAERVKLIGGRFATGPTSSGWMVSVWIPAAPIDMVNAL